MYILLQLATRQSNTVNLEKKCSHVRKIGIVRRSSQYAVRLLIINWPTKKYIGLLHMHDINV